ncbi:DMT family transporter [Bartonella apis]|uniref:EamA-like transporter family protein n=1 Tax=Bartonella apis TaxID=1686310 RepID=A0A1R0F819_9HYPH|nr:DMT family transporter [Bartonella apis]OLY43101.1 EamA-like transporter family protein [Bartonella apis]
MSGVMVSLVLLAALMHALWSVVLKLTGDAKTNITVFMAGSSILALAGIPFQSLPSLASLPFLLISVFVQVVYMMLVGIVYQRGDVSQSYPVMRGVAPLFVALFSGPILGEKLSIVAWCGVILISSGVLTLALEAVRRSDKIEPSIIPLSLLTAAFIALYTLLDGIGVRLSGAPVSYILWIFFLIGLVKVVFELFNDKTRQPFLIHFQRYWSIGLVGGFLSLGSYGLALWTMTKLPVALVAALRESAIVFAVILSYFVLREHVSPPRFVASIIIVLGVIAVRLA